MNRPATIPVQKALSSTRGCARLSTSWLNLASVRRARKRYSFTRSRTYRFSLTGAWRPRFCVALRPPALISIPILRGGKAKAGGQLEARAEPERKGAHGRGLTGRCMCESLCAVPPLLIPPRRLCPR
eukprot:scaffold66934_cov60-Phaeocystis_antarctica.AAC.2